MTKDNNSSYRPPLYFRLNTDFWLWFYTKINSLWTVALLYLLTLVITSLAIMSILKFTLSLATSDKSFGIIVLIWAVVIIVVRLAYKYLFQRKMARDNLLAWQWKLNTVHDQRQRRVCELVLEHKGEIKYDD